MPADWTAELRAPLEPLPRSFYARPVLVVARAMIGTLLVHRTPKGIAAGRIVESEAYRGPEDLAAHSARGRRTQRTEVMYGPPGHAYMFLLYGTSWAFNVVVAEEGQPHAVLVRALEPVLGLELMAERRGKTPGARELTNGPGKLCQALALDRSAYGADLTKSDVFLAPPPEPRSRIRMGRSPRINVDYAGVWAKRPWRFFEIDNRWVSTNPRR